MGREILLRIVDSPMARDITGISRKECNEAPDPAAPDEPSYSRCS